MKMALAVGFRYDNAIEGGVLDWINLYSISTEIGKSKINILPKV
jgi:hypothetical protein